MIGITSYLYYEQTSEREGARIVNKPSEVKKFKGTISKNISSPQLKKMATGRKSKTYIEIRSIDFPLKNNFVVLYEDKKYLVVSSDSAKNGPLPHTIALGEEI